MRSVSNASTNGSADGSADLLATVVEAADILGITPDAVRSRLRRGTLKRSPERGEEGEVLVVLPAPKNCAQSPDTSETVADQSTDQSTDQSATDRDASPTVGLVEALQQRIEHLSNIIDTRDEELRRKDTIIMTMAQRIPELESSQEASPEPREESTQAASEERDGTSYPDDGGAQKPSWWRRFFGFE